MAVSLIGDGYNTGNRAGEGYSFTSMIPLSIPLSKESLLLEFFFFYLDFYADCTIWHIMTPLSWQGHIPFQRKIWARYLNWEEQNK